MKAMEGSEETGQFLGDPRANVRSMLPSRACTFGVTVRCDSQRHVSGLGDCLDRSGSSDEDVV